MDTQEFWNDVEYALEDVDLTAEEFERYLDRRANERAIELLGEFAEVEYG